MIAEQARTMSSYNRWMNERLYELCAQLDDEDRKRDQGAFFGSIHRTLNHLLLGDKIWLGRFEEVAFQARGLDQQLHEDFGELRQDRQATDDRIEQWASQLTDERLASPFRFTTVVNPAARECALWVAVTHFFNHQTHHRGQLTALLSRLGQDYGVTDLIWLPGLVSGPPFEPT